MRPRWSLRASSTLALRGSRHGSRTWSRSTANSRPRSKSWRKRLPKSLPYSMWLRKPEMATPRARLKLRRWRSVMPSWRPGIRSSLRFSKSCKISSRPKPQSSLIPKTPSEQCLTQSTKTSRSWIPSSTTLKPPPQLYQKTTSLCTPAWTCASKHSQSTFTSNYQQPSWTSCSRRTRWNHWAKKWFR